MQYFFEEIAHLGVKETPIVHFRTLSHTWDQVEFNIYVITVTFCLVKFNVQCCAKC